LHTHTHTHTCCVWLLLWFGGGTLGQPLECRAGADVGRRCASIPLDKLLERVVQHAELIYRLSEESCALFEEMFIPLAVRTQHIRGGNTCTSPAFSVPGSKGEVQQISDKWLLHTVLILIQSWIEPLFTLQDTLDRYDNAPNVLLNKTKWVSSKLVSLEQGVTVLIRKMLDEGALTMESHQSWMIESSEPADMVESVTKDYAVLTCFKKDAHKVETFLKLLRCRQTQGLSCFPI
uniref:Somatolactin beta n=1 Tax=Scleropages formosus TaxID=113540 RepID=A0A8C9SVH1_SCLFO